MTYTHSFSPCQYTFATHPLSTGVYAYSSIISSSLATNKKFIYINNRWVSPAYCSPGWSRLVYGWTPSVLSFCYPRYVYRPSRYYIYQSIWDRLVSAYIVVKHSSLISSFISPFTSPLIHTPTLEYSTFASPPIHSVTLLVHIPFYIPSDTHCQTVTHSLTPPPFAHPSDTQFNTLPHNLLGHTCTMRQYY